MKQCQSDDPIPAADNWRLLAPARIAGLPPYLSMSDIRGLLNLRQDPWYLRSATDNVPDGLNIRDAMPKPIPYVPDGYRKNALLFDTTDVVVWAIQSGRIRPDWTAGPVPNAGRGGSPRRTG
jgi:hypothetical protein